MKKAEGNKEYVQKHYEEALKLYTEAIGVFCIGFFFILVQVLPKVLHLIIDLIQKSDHIRENAMWSIFTLTLLSETEISQMSTQNVPFAQEVW